MPAAAEAPPALANPPGVRIVPPPTPPKPPPAPTREIHVTPPAHETFSPNTPPKPDSAKGKLFSAIRKKAGVTEEPAPTAAAKPSARQGAETETTTDAGAAPLNPDGSGAPAAADPNADPGASAAAAATQADGDKGKKVSPWKLVDQYKTKTAELEKQLADAKTASLPETQKKEYLTRIEELTKRNEHLENEMRFVNYEQSDDFKTKYQQPYEKAFTNAMSEMGELTITDPATQQTRQVTDQDILALCSLPLADARRMANELYGDFADDMMAHRKEIRNLWTARQNALKEARETGTKTMQQRMEMVQKHQKEISDFITSNWQAVNQAAFKDEKYGKFFTPVDGDQDGNQRLAKGFELVDRAFTENPNDPRLTPEQRAGVIKRHAAVRNRAAAFGRLNAWLEKAESRVAELEKELAKYKKSTPSNAPSPGGNGQQTAPADPMERLKASLRARAH